MRSGNFELADRALTSPLLSRRYRRRLYPRVFSARIKHTRRLKPDTRQPSGRGETPKSRHSALCRQYCAWRLVEKIRRSAFFPNCSGTRHQSEVVDRGESSPCDLAPGEYQVVALAPPDAAYAGGKEDHLRDRDAVVPPLVATAPSWDRQPRQSSLRVGARTRR